MNKIKLHWELGIVLEDETTQTIGFYSELDMAISALNNANDESAFIDLWHCPEGARSYQLNQEITKKQLNQLTKEN